MELLNEEQAAKVLNVAQRTLQAWRFQGKGPAFVRISSRCIRYRRPDLEAWIDSHLTGGKPTANPAQGLERVK